MRLTLHVVAASALAAGVCFASDPSEARGVVDAYFEDLLARNIDAIGGHLAEDIRFDDRTTTRWYPGGAQATSRAGMLALEKSWGTSAWTFEDPWTIAEDAWVLTVTRLAGVDGATGEVVESPFSTLLRTEAGVITERHDWGDYSVTMHDEAVANEAEARGVVRGVRERVIAAIESGDADAIRDELAEEAHLDHALIDGEERAVGGVDEVVQALLATRGVIAHAGAKVRQALETERCAWYIASVGEGADARAAAVSLLTLDGAIVEARVYVLVGSARHDASVD